MARVKISELSGFDLDRAVAIVGCIPEDDLPNFRPSVDEDQAMEMLDLDGIKFTKFGPHPAPERWLAYKGVIEWQTPLTFSCHGPHSAGPTKMVAALRCFLLAETKDEFIEVGDSDSSVDTERHEGNTAIERPRGV